MVRFVCRLTPDWRNNLTITNSTDASTCDAKVCINDNTVIQKARATISSVAIHYVSSLHEVLAGCLQSFLGVWPLAFTRACKLPFMHPLVDAMYPLRKEQAATSNGHRFLGRQSKSGRASLLEPSRGPHFSGDPYALKRQGATCGYVRQAIPAAAQPVAEATSGNVVTASWGVHQKWQPRGKKKKLLHTVGLAFGLSMPKCL